jgi:hypothetical protein
MVHLRGQVLLGKWHSVPSNAVYCHQINLQGRQEVLDQELETYLPVQLRLLACGKNGSYSTQEAATKTCPATTNRLCMWPPYH